MRKALRDQQENKKRVNKKRKINKISLDKIKQKLVLDKKKKLIFLIIGIILVVIIAVTNYTAFGLVINKKITSKNAKVVELQAIGNEIIPYEDEVLVCRKDRIDSYTKNGNLAWTITQSDIINSEIQTSGKYIQIVNKDKNIIYVYKNKYEIARIKTEGKIYSSNINENGISIVEYATAGNKTALGVYDKNGEIRYNIKLGNKVIGKYIVSDNMKYLAYIDLDISGISAYTSIKLINFKNISEENNAQTIHEVEGGLVYDISFEGKNLVMSEEERYVVYNLSSGKKEEYLISENSIENVSHYNGKCAYVRINPDGKIILNIKNIKDISTKEIEIEEVPKYFTYAYSLVYVSYQNKIQIYNGFGMRIKEYNSDTVITKPVVFNNGKSIAMTISNKLIIFTI